MRPVIIAGTASEVDESVNAALAMKSVSMEWSMPLII